MNEREISLALRRFDAARMAFALEEQERRRVRIAAGLEALEKFWAALDREREVGHGRL